MKREEAQAKADRIRKMALDMITELHLVLPPGEQKDEQDYIDDTREQMSDAFDVVDHLIDFMFCVEDEIEWEDDRLKDAN